LNRFCIAPVSLAQNSAAAKGKAGIHFPHTHFSARPARAVWFLPRRKRSISSVQNGFGFGCIITQIKIRLWRIFRWGILNFSRNFFE
jgi:hypothetical protein